MSSGSELQSVHRQIERVAALDPQAVAVRSAERTLTYGELNDRANRLACHLRHLGIGPECPVVILLERSPELVVGLLAILKAGGAYVPLDAACPPERVARVLEDAAAPLLLTSTRHAPATSGGEAGGVGRRVLLMDNLPAAALSAAATSPDSDSDVGSGALAYIIYTSGSTGRPKGVAVEHRQLSAYLDWAGRMFRVAEGCGAPVQSSVSFDLTVTSLWLPLLAGRTVHLVPEDDTLEVFAELLRQNPDFSLLKVTPSHLEALDALLGDADVSGAARCLVVGGEAFSPRLAARWRRRMPRARILNEYGPTESTVGCTVHEVSESDHSGESLPIGHAVPGTHLYVLGPDGLPVPDGQIGELWIGGIQVTRGYWRRPDLTAERFVPNPFNDPSAPRLYRSGDRVIRRPDGSLAYLGRADRQVKIRGHRIEPVEIETLLGRCHGVREAAVEAVPDGGGSQALVAFLVLTPDGATTVGAIRRVLAGQLPAYMIPSRFAVLERFPLTANGKADRAALRALPALECHANGDEVPAQTPVEMQIAGVWETVLRRRGIGIHDNFFTLGGNSLMALSLMAAIQRQCGQGFRLSEFLRCPTIAGMAARLRGPGTDRTLKPILRTTESGAGAVPATGEQVNLWITHQVVPDPAAYNVIRAARLRGRVDPGWLEQALQTVVGRQDILRTRFRLEGTELLQEVVPGTGPGVEWEDLRNLPAGQREDELHQRLAAVARTPMDLAVAPLWRCLVLRLGDDDQVLVVVLHHILVDEWSMHLIFAELELAYRAASGETVVFPELPVRFADFAVSQRDRSNEEVQAADTAYWKRILSGYRGATLLPPDLPAPEQATGRGGRLAGGISASTWTALQRIAREEGASDFVTALACWQAWLSLRTGRCDVLVGTPVAQRERPEVEHLAGLFLQTLPIRTTVDPTQDFRSLVRLVRQRVSESFAHSTLPLPQILGCCPQIPGNRSPFPTMFILVDRPWPQPSLPGTVAEVLPVHSGTAKSDVIVSLTPGGEGGRRAELEYSLDLYSPERARQFLEEFIAFLGTVTALPDAPAFGAAPEVSCLPMPDPIPTARLRGAVPANLMSLLEESWDSRGKATAIEGGPEPFGYDRLRREYDRLASVLSARGVGPGVTVLLCLDRSAERLIGVLGILKAGGACIPVDPTYPAGRIAAMVEDGQPQVVLTAHAHVPLFRDAGVPILRMEEVASVPAGPGPGPCPAGPRDPAYVIFTSGSTGRPKGVAMPHRALVNLVRWQCRTSVLTPGDRTLQFAPISFDVSFQEIFTTLAQGGALVLIPEEERTDPELLLERIRTWKVNRLMLPFVALRSLADARIPAGAFPMSLKEVFTSGEALRVTPEIAAFFARLPGCRFCNQYGPTETHVVSELELSGPPSSWELMPPIGRAIDGVTLRVCDEALGEVARGVEGELLIGGECLALGYLNQPDRTAERFVCDPLRPEVRWYRTGDRALERADGTLEFRGRLDGQVKVRGYRIELGEVEAALEQHPAVRQAAAVVVEDPSSGGRLVACYVPVEGSDHPVDSEMLRAHVAGSLPAYMVPSSCVALSELPRTPSGKIDRRSLPALIPNRSDPDPSPEVPLTPVQRQLAAIWSEVLGIPSIGIHENFFSLGGHSLSAMKVVSRLRSSLYHDASMRLLFRFPTIAGLARQIPGGEEPRAGPRRGPPRMTGDRCIPERFRTVVGHHRDALALQSGPLRMSYGELDRQSDVLAAHLMASGVTAGSRVGILLGRSAEWVVVVLAVLKAGGVYVPLLPNWPADRLRGLTQDAGVNFMVTGTSGPPDWMPSGVRCVESALRTSPPPAEARRLPDLTLESPAYLLFTSGSTGRPKGVLVPHRAVLRLVLGQDYVSFGPDLRCLHLSSPAFDASTFEVWAPLLHGGTCVVLAEDYPDVDSLEQGVRDGAVNCLFLTTGLFNHVIDTRPSVLTGVAEVLTGGEALSEAHARRALEPRCGVRIVNCYGPTETTTFATTWRIPPLAEWLPGQPLPIGRELAGTRCEILDETGRPVASGEPGELCIGGDGVALGYANDPELTAARFLPDPVDPSGRARRYLTGDRARRLPNGDLEFLGRLDEQVKIRGHRVEPGEIESVLKEDPAVQQAIVVARAADGGVLELVACVQGRPGCVPEVAELRRRLAGRLPEFMLPSEFRVVDAIPLSPSGKVDRRALSAESRSARDVPAAAGSPMSEDEAIVASIWSEVLKRGGVERDDHFFEVGGNSLLVMKVILRLRAAWDIPVPLRLLFEHPTVAGLAAQRSRLTGLRPSAVSGGDAGAGPGASGGPRDMGGETGPPGPIPPVPRDGERLPLTRIPRDLGVAASPAQERLWFLDRLEPGSTAYLMPEALRLRGALDVSALERSLREIVGRHESLRTVFEDGGGFPRPLLRPIPDALLTVEDLSGISPADRDRRVEELLAEEARQPFELASGPLFRFRLIRLASGENLFLRTMHHIVFDGWSGGVFNRELSALYGAFSRNQPSPLAPLAIQYPDFSAWQRRMLDGAELERLLNHWTQRLAGAPPRLLLPVDGVGLRRPGDGSQTCVLGLPGDLAVAMDRLAHAAGATPFMVLLSAFQVLMARWSGQEDLVIGTPFAGRTHVATESLIGFFISTIALRTDLSGNPTFLQLIHRVRETLLSAQDHQELPFEKLIERLHPDGAARHHPVFQVLFNLVNFEDELPALDGLEVRRETLPAPDPKFDLTVYVILRPGALSFRASYPADRFQHPTVERMLEQFQQLLEQFVRDPELPILVPSLVLARDRPVLPAPDLPLVGVPQPAIHHEFESQARRTPRRLAVRDPGREWTYGELDAAGDELAHHLRRSGVGRGDTVAVFAVPSGFLVVALLGVFKAGARFLVLDAAQPEARLRSLVDQARPAALLHLDAAGDLPRLLQEFAEGPGLRGVTRLPSGLPSHPGSPIPATPVSGDDPAYIVFTSGSTGEPLGILGDHGPVSHFLRWHRHRFHLTGEDRFSLLSGPGHDPLMRDIFTPLSSGASLHIPPAEVRHSHLQMQSWFESEGITASHLTPGLAQILSGAGPDPGPRLDGLRWVFIGGDRLTAATVLSLRQRAPAAGIVNFYGTTETPQAMSYHVAVPPGMPGHAADLWGDAVPLGRPVEDVQLILINGAGQPAGIGELAEVTIRTPYLSRGYLQADARARSRYGVNPVTGLDSDRVYRTGDLGRYLPDGTVVFVGRRDGQIKIRGHRIEPDEILRALRRHPAVLDGAVSTETGADAEVSIRAHLVLRDPQSPPSRASLRALLKSSLPDAAIPSRVLVLPALPLTPNGKVDTRALDRAGAVELPAERSETEPRTEGERQLLSIWREVLGRPSAGIHDNFFDLGGHSLLALRLITTLHQQLNSPVTLADLFAHPTVAELSDIGSPMARSADSRARAFRGEGSGAPWFHIPGVFGFEFLTPSLARVIGRHCRYHDGLQYPGVDGRRDPASTVTEIASDLVRQIADLWPEGPVRLSGYSMGGTVAFEVARQLSDSGRTVERVFLFDTRLLARARRNPFGKQIRILTGQFYSRPAGLRWRWLGRLTRRKLAQHVRRHLRRLGVASRDLNARMEAAAWAASAAHSPRPYSGPVTLFRSTRMGEFDSGAWERDPHNGWGPMLHPGFEIRNLACDHEQVFLDPVCPEVLEALEALLTAPR